jgi:hypothetical protein
LTSLFSYFFYNRRLRNEARTGEEFEAKRGIVVSSTVVIGLLLLLLVLFWLGVGRLFHLCFFREKLISFFPVLYLCPVD